MELVSKMSTLHSGINVITRTSDNIALKGFYFESWERLEIQLETESLKRKCIFSDLSLGAWKGHWVLNELSNQLGLKPYEKVQPLIGVDSEGNDYADTIGLLIDNESIGDQNFIIAYEQCKKIIARISELELEWVIIIAPLQKTQWQKENIQFIELLTQGLKKTNCELGVVSYGDTNLPEHWHIDYRYKVPKNHINKVGCAVPGLIEHKLFKLLALHDSDDFLALSSNLIVVSPKLRSGNFQEIEDSMIAASKLKYSHLSAAIELRQLTESSDTFFLQLEASKRFAEGGYGIALYILESIRNCVKSANELISVIAMIQNIRIALMYFDDAAAEELPDLQLSDEQKASLYQSKAWGLVMTNQSEKAEPYFELARNFLSEEKHPRLYLYLLNISALNKLKNGKTDEAFAFEKRIEKELAKQKKRDWHVDYINSINQARLYKYIKDFESAEKYYQKAFDTNRNLKVESDYLYTNLCLAQLEELKGNINGAFIFWLRTCLHWLSNEVPEALAPRVAQAILIKRLSSQGAKVEEISEKLMHYLRLVAEQTKLPKREPEIIKQAVFLRIERANHLPKVAIGTHGISVHVSNEVELPAYEGKKYNELANYVYQLMCDLLPSLKNYSIVYTEGQLGNEIPATFNELISSSIRHKTSKVIFGKHKSSFSTQEQQTLFSSSKVEISSAISFVKKMDKGMNVYFKRYRKVEFLNESQKTILQNISENTTVSNFYKPNEDPILINELLIHMQERRLIKIYI
jgi:Uri superfamily endonuclease